MFRIDSDGAVASLPDPKDAGAVSGYFDPGDPGVGQRATVVGYDWANAVQESIVHPIEKRGISLRKESPYDLLTEAIQSFVAQSGNPSGVCLSLSSGILSIIGENGSALSDTNFGYVPGRSVTGGKRIALKIAEPIFLKDNASGASDVQGVGFGITEAAHWAENMPMFFYSVSKADTEISDTDGNSAIFISRSPCLKVTPASSLIGKRGAAPSSDTQESIVLLGSTYTVANYAALPCQLIGGFAWQWSTTPDDWTIQALTSFGGLGEGALNDIFANDWTMPMEQNGASAGTYLLPNGGTAPIFSDNFYLYQIRRSGEIVVKYYMQGDGGTDGSGAVSTRLSLPAAIAYVATASIYLWGGEVTAATTLANGAMVFANLTHGNSFCLFSYESAAVQTSQLRNNNFTNGSRSLVGGFSYKAFA